VFEAIATIRAQLDNYQQGISIFAKASQQDRKEQASEQADPTGQDDAPISTSVELSLRKVLHPRNSAEFNEMSGEVFTMRKMES
jgi:hypothetical protein